MLKTIVFFSVLTSSLMAHGGRTNSEGCHNNRKTGGYHCHGGKSKAKPTPIAKPLACGNKTYCYEMNSCAEVMFYFEQCGLSRLDGDHDGVPCEKVCG